MWWHLAGKVKGRARCLKTTRPFVADMFAEPTLLVGAGKRKTLEGRVNVALCERGDASAVRRRKSVLSIWTTSQADCFTASCAGRRRSCAASVIGAGCTALAAPARSSPGENRSNEQPPSTSAPSRAKNSTEHGKIGIDNDRQC